MVRITYVAADGEEQLVDARPGQSLMEAAVKNGVRGIAADCGGSCACATCRVYVPEQWRATLGQPNDLEQPMLEYSGDTHPGVRLSCQIKVTADLDGLVLHLPESQHQ